MEADLDKRYQTILTLWAGLLMSVVMYFIFMQFIVPDFGPRTEPPNQVLIIVMIGVSALFVLASFFVKARLLQRSVESQDLGLVQKAVIIACAMCEVSAVLGMIAGWIFSSRISYLLFLMAGAAVVLHFPRRSQLEAASYKRSSGLN
jgi:divalent metal cation (Fe/Co/Zn/Cd) transporter